jgi:CBS domain-containing protein
MIEGEFMTVSDICIKNVITIEKDKSLTEASMLMRKHHVGDVVVVERKDSQFFPLGIVTDRDLVLEVVATELDPDVITVGDIMLETLVVVNSDADLMQASKLMASKGVRRMPVVSNDGVLEGIVTLDDLLEVVGNIFSNLTKLFNKQQKNEFNNRR